jgi:hypothetical protein
VRYSLQAAAAPGGHETHQGRNKVFSPETREKQDYGIKKEEMNDASSSSWIYSWERSR